MRFTIGTTVGLLIATLALATACGAQTVVFSEDFSDNSAGWTLGPEWQIGPATASPSPGAGGNGDPGTDHTPTADNGVAGTIIGGNVTTSVHGYYYITSPIIDTSGYGSVSLSFWRWLNIDYTPFMSAIVQVYDGAVWQTLFETGGAPGTQDSAWTQFTYNLSPYTGTSTRIRFGHQVGSNGAYTVSGWNLDDIAITGTPPTLALSHTGPTTQQVDEDSQGPGGDGLVLASVEAINPTASAETLTDITFSQAGTADGQADINFLALYEDTNTNGSFDGPATDLLATAASGISFSAPTGDYVATLANPTVPASSTRRFFLVTKLAGSADFGETLQANITAATASSGPSGIPALASQPGLQISTPELDVDVTGPFVPVTVESSSQGPSGNGEVLSDFTLTAEYDAWTVSSITFSASGTADEQATIEFLALYEDTNTNGIFDGPTTDLLATAVEGTSFDAADGDYVATLAAGFADFTLGQSKRFFLVCKLNGLALPGDTFAVDIAAVSETSARGGAVDLPGTPTDALVIDANNSLIMGHGPNNPGSRLVGGGAAVGATLAQFRITGFTAAASVDYIDLDTGGTGDWASDLDVTNGVEIYLDDGDGAFGAGDTLLFSGPGAATISGTFTTPVTVPGGGWRDFWVRVNLLATAGASPPETFRCEVAAFGGVASTKLFASVPLSSNVLSVADFGVTAFAPLTDAAAGGAAITIDGMGFNAPVVVTIGGVTCPGVAVINPAGTQITGLTVPAGSGQNLPIHVSSGGLSILLAQTFSYPTPSSGGSDGDDDSACSTGQTGGFWWLALLPMAVLAARQRHPRRTR